MNNVGEQHDTHASLLSWLLIGSLLKQVLRRSMKGKGKEEDEEKN